MVTYCTGCGDRISLPRKEMQAGGRVRSFLCPLCRDQAVPALEQGQKIVVEGLSPSREVTEKR